MASPPAIWNSEVTLRCARGTKRVTVVGPTAAAAVRKATEMDTSAYGLRCQVQSIQLVKRGAGAGLAGVRRGRARRRSGGLRGHAEVSELKLFIDNDGDLYRQRTTPIQKNLERKLKKGIYNRALAEKTWMYLVEDGAKKYARDAGAGGTWHKMFSIADRKQVAKDLNDSFITEYRMRNG